MFIKTKITYYTEYIPKIYWSGQFNYEKYIMFLNYCLYLCVKCI